MWSTYTSVILKAKIQSLAVAKDGKSLWMLQGPHYWLGQQVWADKSLDMFSWQYDAKRIKIRPRNSTCSLEV